MQVKELLKTLKKDPVRRTFLLDRATVKATERTIDLAFSSELPYVRWWGIEILDHTKGAMRMGRAKDGIAVLFNHDRDAHLGVMGDCRCDDDKMGRGMARFGQGPLASEKWKDVEDGILKDVSVGYEIHFMKEMPTKELSPELLEMAAREKLPVYRITDWEPYECSFVTVPADPTVGVGRTAEPHGVQDKAIEIINPTTIKEARTMDPEKDLKQYEEDMRKEREKAAATARESAETRVTGIFELGRKFSAWIPQFMTDKAVKDGVPLEDFKSIVLGRVESGSPIDTPVAELGLSQRDIKRYSITRAILSQVPSEKVEASFELDLHKELVKRGIEPRNSGILVPYDIVKHQKADTRGAGQRDLSLQSDAAGAYLKGTDHLGSEFIDVLRNAMVLRRAGARVLTGLRGNVAIPKRTAGATSYWVTETNAPTEGANTFAQLALTPKTVGAFIDYTRELMIQSDPSIDGLVNGDLALSLATAIDLAGFHGTGTEQPQGIVGTSNVGSTTATTVDFGKMLGFQTDVAAANALSGSCAYITTPAVAAILAAKSKWTNGVVGLWDGNILESSNVCGFRGYATNQITAGYMIFGDFSQVIVGEWGVLELLVNPYITSSTRIIRVTAFQSVDVGLRYPAAFSVSTSVTAS